MRSSQDSIGWMTNNFELTKIVSNAAESTVAPSTLKARVGLLTRKAPLLLDAYTFSSFGQTMWISNFGCLLLFACAFSATYTTRSLWRALLAFPHEPQSTLFNNNKRGVCVVCPWNEWAYLWIAWNHVLTDEISLDAHKARKRRNDRRYVSFNTCHMLQKVKNKLNKYVSIQHEDWKDTRLAQICLSHKWPLWNPAYQYVNLSELLLYEQ